MRKRWMFIVPAAILGIVLVTALGGAIVRQLWNALLPPLFGWPAVTFWQALGLLVLCRILFGGIGRYPSGGSRLRRRIDERWEHMTPEERERLRHRLRERWGVGPAAGEGRPD